MATPVETVRTLGSGERVRLRFSDDTTLELRVSQRNLEPDERLHVELTDDETMDGTRYWMGSDYDDGDWGPLSARRYDRGDQSWQTLGEIVDVVPLGMFQTFKSDDMAAQEAHHVTAQEAHHVTAQEAHQEHAIRETPSDETNRGIRLNNLPGILENFEFPCPQQTAVGRGDDFFLELVGGRAKLSNIISRSTDDSFDSCDDLALEILNLLPRPAVGEPYQSEGDA